MRRLVLICLLSLCAPMASAQQRTVPQNRDEITMSFAPLVKRTAPSVVNVYAKSIVEQPEDRGALADPFFRRFFGQDGSSGPPRQRVANSLGSGVIVDGTGIIVTNNHVINQVNTTMT